MRHVHEFGRRWSSGNEVRLGNGDTLAFPRTQVAQVGRSGHRQDTGVCCDREPCLPSAVRFLNRVCVASAMYLRFRVWGDKALGNVTYKYVSSLQGGLLWQMSRNKTYKPSKANFCSFKNATFNQIRGWFQRKCHSPSNLIKLSLSLMHTPWRILSKSHLLKLKDL